MVMDIKSCSNPTIFLTTNTMEAIRTNKFSPTGWRLADEHDGNYESEQAFAQEHSI